MSCAEQAVVIRDWMQRWGLDPLTTKVVCDDAVFNATGGVRGSVAGDFKASGCPLVRAGKMNTRAVNGWALMRTMLQATGQSTDVPWLQWTMACQGLMATVPVLPRHERDMEMPATLGVADHAADSIRYGITWYQSRYKTGTRSGAHPLMWK